MYQLQLSTGCAYGRECPGEFEGAQACGTSFLMFVMIVGIVLLFFVKTESHILRVVIRIALLPIIAGISV